jgi:predicted enzyme related to lactoylglutathione lyase
MSCDRKALIMSSQVLAVSFDARDARAAASFWAAALGRTVADGADSNNAAVTADPAVPGSRISFHQVPESKTVKNRMHFDLITADLDAEVTRLTGLGATRLNEINAHRHWVTLADPEGNEFDVIAG